MSPAFCPQNGCVAFPFGWKRKDCGLDVLLVPFERERERLCIYPLVYVMSFFAGLFVCMMCSWYGFWTFAEVPSYASYHRSWPLIGRASSFAMSFVAGEKRGVAYLGAEATLETSPRGGPSSPRHIRKPYRGPRTFSSLPRHHHSSHPSPSDTPPHISTTSLVPTASTTPQRHYTAKMPRQSRGPAPSSRSAPARPTPTPQTRPAAPQQPPQARQASTAAHPPQQQQAPPAQGSQGPGLFGQMASTAA